MSAMLPKIEELGKIWKKTFGPLPDDYLVFDLETSGLDSDRDVILQIGWCRVLNRKVKENKAIVLNWQSYLEPAELEILRGRLAYTSDSMHRRGLGYNWSIDRINREGVDPKTGFVEFAKYLSRSPILIGHHCWKHDLPFVDKCSRRLTRMGVGIPDTRMLDTFALVKSAQSGAFPLPTDTYKSFSKRAVSAGGNKYRGALDKFCVPALHLDAKYGVNTSTMHDAAVDSLVTHYVVEELRLLMFPDKQESK